MGMIKALLPLLLTLEKSSASTCFPGTYTAACLPCPTGTFSSVGGAVACIPCPEGSDSPPGAAACLTRCGWADAAAATAATQPTLNQAGFSMMSQCNVVCPLDHYCPDADDEIAVSTVAIAIAAA